MLVRANFTFLLSKFTLQNKTKQNKTKEESERSRSKMKTRMQTRSATSYRPGQYYKQDQSLGITDDGIRTTVRDTQIECTDCPKSDKLELQRIWTRQLVFRDALSCVHNNDAKSLDKVASYARSTGIYAPASKYTDASGSRDILHNPMLLLDRDGNGHLSESPIWISILSQSTRVFVYLCGPKADALSHLSIEPPNRFENGGSKWTARKLLMGVAAKRGEPRSNQHFLVEAVRILSSKLASANLD